MKTYRMLSVTKAIENIVDKRLKQLFAEGAFPEVEYKNSGTFKSYNLFAYCDVLGKFTKILDRKIKETLNEELGIYTRKHSETFLTAVSKLVDDITEFDVLGQREHFRTFADEIKDNIPV